MSKVMLVLAIALVAAGSASGGRAGFSADVTNPWFPLTPGTTYTYEGIKDGKPSREKLTVTNRVKAIQGKPCRVVEDRLYVGGELVERTSDWYSQDGAGNVWYFGEDTAELEHGKVTTKEGSWQAGVDGARAGILMPASPRPGQTGTQEYYKGHAEDHFRVVGYLGKNAVLIEESTALEKGVLDHKLYVRGSGTVLERTVNGGDELNELVKVERS